MLGKRAYDRLTSEIGIDDQLVFVAASGRYSFKGTAWVRSGRFERVQVVQDQTTIPLTANGYHNVEQLAIEGSPELREIGVFILPAQSGFDPMRAWRLDLLVDSGGTIPPAIFAIDYRLPDRYVLSSAVQAAGEPVTEDALLEDVPSGSRRGEIASGPSAAFCFSSERSRRSWSFRTGLPATNAFTAASVWLFSRSRWFGWAGSSAASWSSTCSPSCTR